MEVIDNVSKIVRDDLVETIKPHSRISIAAACFSIYAYQELKKQLTTVDECRFIFTSPTFVTDKTEKEKREFFIPRLSRERSLYVTEFEVKLRNELTQRAIARECAEWIKKKAIFKSNSTQEVMQGFMNVESEGQALTYFPLNGFTTVDIGCDRGRNVFNWVNKFDAPFSAEYIKLFDRIWDDESRMQDVTEEVIAKLAVYHTKLIQTEWMPKSELSVELKGFDLDAVWENIIIQVGGIRMEQGHSLDEQIALDEKRAKIQKEIDRLEKLARAEKQPKKKFELVQEIKKLKEQVDLQ